MQAAYKIGVASPQVPAEQKILYTQTDLYYFAWQTEPELAKRSIEWHGYKKVYN